MERLDVALVRRGFTESRTKAQRLIAEKAVTVNGVTAEKASFPVDENAEITVAPADISRYVSRGGLKLEAALNAFRIDPHGCVALDVGASTGGFTDCLLQHGAAKVYAVDSGTSQLADVLRADARVVSLENTNARYMDKSFFQDEIKLAVMDVSFISQTLLFPALATVLSKGATLITLAKPQFEVGKRALSKNGIVKSDAEREKAVRHIIEVAEMYGFHFHRRIDSPITGGDGNREYLLLFTRTESEDNG